MNESHRSLPDKRQLKVKRLTKPTGFWFWRRCEYLVYWEDNKGIQWEVLRNEFCNHKQALTAARKIVRH